MQAEAVQGTHARGQAQGKCSQLGIQFYHKVSESDDLQSRLKQIEVLSF